MAAVQREGCEGHRGLQNSLTCFPGNYRLEFNKRRREIMKNMSGTELESMRLTMKRCYTECKESEDLPCPFCFDSMSITKGMVLLSSFWRHVSTYHAEKLNEISDNKE